MWGLMDARTRMVMERRRVDDVCVRADDDHDDDDEDEDGTMGKSSMLCEERGQRKSGRASGVEAMTVNWARMALVWLCAPFLYPSSSHASFPRLKVRAFALIVLARAFHSLLIGLRLYCFALPR